MVGRKVRRKGNHQVEELIGDMMSVRAESSQDIDKRGVYNDAAEGRE